MGKLENFVNKMEKKVTSSEERKIKKHKINYRYLVPGTLYII